MLLLHLKAEAHSLKNFELCCLVCCDNGKVLTNIIDKTCVNGCQKFIWFREEVHVTFLVEETNLLRYHFRIHRKAIQLLCGGRQYASPKCQNIYLLHSVQTQKKTTICLFYEPDLFSLVECSNSPNLILMNWNQQWVLCENNMDVIR